MKKIKPISLFVITCLMTKLLFSQTNMSLENATIETQFDYVLSKSGDFIGSNGQMYEAVKLSLFQTLRAHTLDSLNTAHKTLANAQAIVKLQANQIDSLQTTLSKTKSDLESLTSKKNSMSFLGLQMSKIWYNILIFTIILSLLALLILFVFKFKYSNVVTKNAEKALKDTEEAFENHRKTALEREQKVRRQLLDEINKQKKT